MLSAGGSPSTAKFRPPQGAWEGRWWAEEDEPSTALYTWGPISRTFQSGGDEVLAEWEQRRRPWSQRKFLQRGPHEVLNGCPGTDMRINLNEDLRREGKGSTIRSKMGTKWDSRDGHQMGINLQLVDVVSPCSAG